MRRIRQHLTYANVMATIAVFIAISGGTAVALNGTNTVFTDDITDDNQPAGGLVAADLRPNSVGSSEAANESLTGADIKNRSGVETCPAPATTKFGSLCAGSDGVGRIWNGAVNYCTDLGLRLPSITEAITLAKEHDVPGGDGHFWTEAFFYIGNNQSSWAVAESGFSYIDRYSEPKTTVCVTDPSA